MVAVQDAALDFVTRYRQDLFAETPVVFEASRRAADAAPDATGIVTEFDLRQTLTLATALQPETAEVFVVTGASARDKAYEQMARAQFRSFEPRLAFVYLSGLTAGELDRRMSTLPKRAIVFYLLFYQTGDGENVNPLAYLDHLAAVSNRPIYSWVDSTMDHGVVGGAMASIPSRIEALAGVALRVLHGEPAHSIPVVTAANLSVAQVDWRQLQRWRIRPLLVPAGTAILFRDPGVWDGTGPTSFQCSCSC